MTHPSIQEARRVLARTERIEAEVLRRRLGKTSGSHQARESTLGEEAPGADA